MVARSAWQIMHNTQSMDKQEYEAVVVSDDSDDPKTGKDPKGLGRVRLRIRGLHDGVPDEHLPWASKSETRAGGGGTGSAGVPPKGTKIRVTMRDNSPYSPEYSAAPATEDTKVEEEFKSEYGNVEGHIDPAGNKFSQQTRDGNNVTTFHHASGTSIVIGNDGSVNIAGAKKGAISFAEELVLSSKKVKIHGQDGVEIAGNGKVLITSKEEVAFAAPQVTSSIVPITPNGYSPLDPTAPSATTARSRPKPNLKV